ncbi:replication-relaxation family protein [Heyndrickxia sporothermodurans]|uniref:replication-relaxation family protein n=1 Tax=Heyndrickxia sporothermodurans TaxID=46224 RepID=UPI001F1EE1B2|nr:replication-relaxation family protein [Heyndrickxia sporothermodurans]
MDQLTQRQERILLSLKKLDFLNRDQLSQIHKLGKVRNTNRILNELSPYLSKYREEYSTIYYLNSQGRQYVNSQKIRRKNQFVNHIIMRNDFYIFCKCPVEWENEIRLKDNHYTVICDAFFKMNKKYYCLEVDSTQKMKVNRAKIQQYIGLYRGGAIKEHFGHFPGVIWLTTTELRKKQLKELCSGLPCAVYTIKEIR